MRGIGLAVAMALGAVLGMAGAASCTGGATAEEACSALCACREALFPSRRPACETQCLQSAQQGSLAQACLDCVVDTEDCRRLDSVCAASCGGALTP
jgi:hypothetical protein